MKQGKPEDANLGEVVQTIIGMKLPAGAQKSFLDSLPELLSATEGKEADRLQKALGTLLGDFAGRFVQPGQPVFAYFDQFDREAQAGRDPNAVEGSDILLDTAKARVSAKIPGLKEELPVAQAKLRKETPMRGGEFFATLSGFRFVPSANAVERESNRLNLDPYTFYGSSGDKIYDRNVVKNTIPFIEKLVVKLLDSDRYKKMSDAEKKVAFKNNMATAVSIGRDLTQAGMMTGDIKRVNKMAFNRLSSIDRKAINEMYARDHDGKTMDQAGDYSKVYEYKGKLEGLR
jgi:hypothetical protein